MSELLPRRASVARATAIGAALIAMLAVAACSHEQVYNAIQQNQQLECQKLPGAQYDECMEQLSEPYQEYQRSREELLEDGES